MSKPTGTLTDTLSTKPVRKDRLGRESHGGEDADCVLLGSEAVWSSDGYQRFGERMHRVKSQKTSIESVIFKTT